MGEYNFRKYQGLGNDFIIFEEKDIKELNFSRLAKAVCNRNYGIGADGMAVIKKDLSNWEMIFYNADGTEAPMCGNASRCVADYLRVKYHQKESFKLKTKGAILKMKYVDSDISVNLAKADFKVKSIPVKSQKSTFLMHDLTVAGKRLKISAVFMTTSHAVVFLDDYKNYDLEELGKSIENHPLFPEKINVNFVIQETRDQLRQKTWERGVGMTLACGTGAAASVAVAHELSLVTDQVKVIMDGGSLMINVNQDGEIIMQGKVAEIARGQYFYVKE